MAEAKWIPELKRITQNMENIAHPPSRCIYLHQPTGTIMNVEKLSNGGLRIELPLLRAGITKSFLVGASKDNLALVVRLGEDDPIEKMICTGERAFKELKKIEREASIVGGESLTDKIKEMYPATS